MIGMQSDQIANHDIADCTTGIVLHVHQTQRGGWQHVITQQIRRLVIYDS